nr:conjugal transfer protein TraN [Roseobacter sp. HKCCD8198]
MLCGAPVTTCTSGPSVEVVNDELVPMTCTEEQTEWTCASTEYMSDCGSLETDPGCSLTNSVCYAMDEDGVCGTFEQTYQCGSQDSQAFDATCEAVNVTVGGVTQSIPHNTSDDIGHALVGIETLNTLATEFEHDMSLADRLLGNVNDDFDVQYFSATRRRCRVGILRSINCCRDSGWALGVIAECNEDEVALYGALQAGSAVYMSTYCSERLLFVCAERSRRYCTYNSRIARIISEQGQRQLYGSFSCRAMTQEELNEIDWNRIDFSSAFGEAFETVGSIAPSDLSGLIQDNILLSHPEVRDVYE